MIKILFTLGLFFNFLFSSFVEESKWGNGESFLLFLERNALPLKLYYDLDIEDKELLSEIRANQNYHLLKSDEGKLEQILIPISEELQVHIFRDEVFKLKIVPISYQEREEILTLSIEHSPYQDILKSTNNVALATEFISSYKDSINFRRNIRKGDNLAIIYHQKYRLGKLFSEPDIKMAMIETRGRENYIFKYDDGHYYDDEAMAINGFFLKVPLKYRRISSKFTKKRWHPILKRYRAHLGTDFAANRGTPIYASADGKVTYKGRKGGYGKTIILVHKDGYKTLYAHLNGYKRGVRAGKYVKQGDLIGYVGSTGLSTGPHLHFGVYKNGVAQDPMRAVKTKVVEYLKGKKKRDFLSRVKIQKGFIREVIAKHLTPSKVKKDFIYLVNIDSNELEIQN